MPKVASQGIAELIDNSVKHFLSWFKQVGAGKIFMHMDIRSGPPEVKDIIDMLTKFLSKAIGLREPTWKVSEDDKEWSFDDKYIPLVKRSILMARLDMANSLSHSLNRTNHPDIIQELNYKLIPYNQIISERWFVESPPLVVPPLSKYLRLSEIEVKNYSLQMLEGEFGTQKRLLDDKFGILQTPTAFLQDLKDMRSDSELRGGSVTVAYIDIDNFKSFNLKYGGETEVDQKMLPIFMQALESHVFGHGWAYRIGGDEYEILLPNFSFNLATQFLKEFQEKLKTLEYIYIDEKPTVSIGFCYIDGDCFLTDREIEGKACKAKAFAKQNGRDRIATYSSSLFREEDLTIVE